MAIQASLVEQLGEQNPIQPRQRSRSGLFVGLIACSVLAHGVFLGLPWPEVEFNPEVADPVLEDASESAIDVAILPPGTVQRSDEVESVETTPSAEVVAEPAVTRSPQPTSPQAVPPPVPDQIAPTTQPPEQSPGSVDELPPEPGTPGLSDPDPVPPATLQERLQDVTAYQHDGTKNLGDDTFIEAQNWAVTGQIYPSKADPMELPYELGDTCLDHAPLRGTLMVVVDEVGNFRRGPEVISSTGYDVLDDYAEDFVRTGQYRLPDEGEPKAYSVDVQVLYPSTCP